MRGRYQVGERVERFSCGGGRYTSTDEFGDTLDLTVDDQGRVRRLLAAFDGWEVRGGSVGEELYWVRGEDEHTAKAAGFTGSSPGFDLAMVRMLGLAVGESKRVTLVELAQPIGAARTVTHGWARTEGPEPGVDRYEVADLDTAERWVLHVAGEVLVSREGRFPAHLRELAP